VLKISSLNDLTATGSTAWLVGAVLNFSFWGVNSHGIDAIGNLSLKGGGGGTVRTYFTGDKCGGTVGCSGTLSVDCSRIDWDNNSSFYRVASAAPPPLPPPPLCNLTGVWNASGAVHSVYSHGCWLVTIDPDGCDPSVCRQSAQSFGTVTGSALRVTRGSVASATISHDCTTLTWVASNITWLRSTRAPPFPIPGRPRPCRDDHGCSLLGICSVATGACACDPGWTGHDCSQADLKPLDLQLGYDNGTDHSWGGRPLRDPTTGRWSLYVCQFLLGCDVGHWTTNSAVIRAEASSAAGPYAFAEEVLPTFHTNPTVVGPTVDGFWLMFTVGRPAPGIAINCTRNPGAAPTAGAGSAAGRILMSYSRSAAGPWSVSPRTILTNGVVKPGEQPSDWDCMISNPSAVLLRNGSIVIVFSALPCTGPNYGKSGTSLGVAYSPHWNGTYEQRKAPIWLKVGPAWPEPSARGVGNVEDPFAFHDKRGNFHIVGHSQGLLNICGGSGGEVEGNSCGIHFFAESFLGPWHYSLTPVYSRAVNLSTGGSTQLWARQRPQLVFGATGDNGSSVPRYLFNAGSGLHSSLIHGSRSTLSTTLAFEFNAAR
jgi:hypothetical protein